MPVSRWHVSTLHSLYTYTLLIRFLFLIPIGSSYSIPINDRLHIYLYYCIAWTQRYCIIRGVEENFIDIDLFHVGGND